MVTTDIHAGVRRAAQRKLEQELGIPAHEVRGLILSPLLNVAIIGAAGRLPVLDAHPLQGKQRCHVGRAREYDVISHWLFSRAPVDYIFFIQKDVTVHPNPIEVKSFRYLTQPELRHFMDNAGVCGSFDVFPTRERERESLSLSF
jgi:isopentenyldiphosphate isomerase